jgi:hypothetical protein
LCCKSAQWLGAARFFRRLRKNIFVEKALLGERAEQAKHVVRRSDEARSGIVGKA